MRRWCSRSVLRTKFLRKPSCRRCSSASPTRPPLTQCGLASPWPSSVTSAAISTKAADLKEQAAEAAGIDERRGLLLDVARTARGPLGDLPRAARIFAVLREREPADREILGAASRNSIARSTRPRASSSSSPRLCRSSIRPPSAGGCDSSRRRCFCGSPATESQATDFLREVLDEDPSQVEAAMLLLGMLEKSGRKDELASLLGRQLDAAKDRGDVASIVSLSMRLGALLEERGELTEALDAYHAALDWDRIEQGSSSGARPPFRIARRSFRDRRRAREARGRRNGRDRGRAGHAHLHAAYRAGRFRARRARARGGPEGASGEHRALRASHCPLPGARCLPGAFVAASPSVRSCARQPVACSARCSTPTGRSTSSMRRPAQSVPPWQSRPKRVALP